MNLSKTISINKKHLTIKLGDITKEDGDAIVNAANEHLIHAGGVARAIATAAGPKLTEESNKIGFVKTGEAVFTSGGNLKVKYVIHTAGPIWKGGNSNEKNLLKSCLISSLELAEKLKVIKISIPAISTGIYGFPIDLASKILIDTAYIFLAKHAFNIETIQFILFMKNDYNQFLQAINSINL